MIRQIFLVIFITLAAVAGYFFIPAPSNVETTIAITQITDHPTLDTVRQGTVDEIQKSLPNAKIVFENAHGNLAQAQQIAHRFVGLKPAVIIAVSTQSAQVLKLMAEQNHIPLIYTAVTDPVEAKLTGDMINGISDFMPARPQLDLIKHFSPNLKRLGVIYNPSEVNSVSYLKHFTEVAKELNIEVVTSPILNTQEARSATLQLAGKVEAVYFPNDNTAMAAAKTIAGVAAEIHLPLFANDRASVELGAIAGLGYDRYQMGIETGKLAVKVAKLTPAEFTLIDKIKPEPVAIEVIINKSAAQKINLHVPELKGTAVRYVAE